MLLLTLHVVLVDVAAESHALGVVLSQVLLLTFDVVLSQVLLLAFDVVLSQVLLLAFDVVLSQVLLLAFDVVLSQMLLLAFDVVLGQLVLLLTFGVVLGQLCFFWPSASSSARRFFWPSTSSSDCAWSSWSDISDPFPGWESFFRTHFPPGYSRLQPCVTVG